jgi:hypothetical protein
LRPAGQNTVVPLNPGLDRPVCGRPAGTFPGFDFPAKTTKGIAGYLGQGHFVSPWFVRATHRLYLVDFHKSRKYFFPSQLRGLGSREPALTISLSIMSRIWSFTVRPVLLTRPSRNRFCQSDSRTVVIFFLCRLLAYALSLIKPSPVVGFHYLTFQKESVKNFLRIRPLGLLVEIRKVCLVCKDKPTRGNKMAAAIEIGTRVGLYETVHGIKWVKIGNVVEISEGRARVKWAYWRWENGQTREDTKRTWVKLSRLTVNPVEF